MIWTSKILWLHLMELQQFIQSYIRTLHNDKFQNGASYCCGSQHRYPTSTSDFLFRLPVHIRKILSTQYWKVNCQPLHFLYPPTDWNVTLKDKKLENKRNLQCFCTRLKKCHIKLPWTLEISSKLYAESNQYLLWVDGISLIFSIYTSTL